MYLDIYKEDFDGLSSIKLLMYIFLKIFLGTYLGNNNLGKL